VARHIVNIVVIWVVLTVLGALVLTLDYLPVIGAEYSEEFDGIFRLLAFMGLPVLTFVFAWVGYSFFAFRQRTGESEGPAWWGRNWVPIAWLAVTASLAITVMIYPGLTGLAKLQADPRGYGWGETGADLVVKVTGFRWSWAFEYPEQGITVNAVQGRELVLPVDATVRFEVNSTDVVHSFWIPAFRMKIDAIPGRTTYMVVKPVAIGSYAEDQAFRAQCAELCGLDHSKMVLPVRVVEREEFEAWVQQMKAQ
jgi:cytochrome c oxidase subunit 2